jgi:hypothetical protein
MQNVINTVRGTALGVAEYLTPVLKVSTDVYSKHIINQTELGE